MIFVIGGVFYMASKVLEVKNSIDTTKTEVDTLKEKVVSNQSSVHLSESEVDKYNSILDQLIPQREDYFSILYSLETLSTDTGFNITKYSLNLSQSQKDTITIGIEGNGNTDS